MNKLSTSIFILGLLYSFCSDAQIDVSQNVLGSAGSYFQSNGQYNLSYTVGEGAVVTLTSPLSSLTQGFHQPLGEGMLLFEIVVTDASCPTSSDGSASLINIIGCTPPYIITWSTGDQGFSVDRLTQGTYSVTVETSQCDRVIFFEVGSGPVEFCRLRFFNAFSPNGDGQNDVWEIENISLPEFGNNQVEIYNRWGQMVWKETGYNNIDVVWNGASMNGVALPDGTYFYLANISGEIFKGYIDLTR